MHNLIYTYTYVSKRSITCQLEPVTWGRQGSEMVAAANHIKSTIAPNCTSSIAFFPATADVPSDLTESILVGLSIRPVRLYSQNWNQWARASTHTSINRRNE